MRVQDECRRRAAGAAVRGVPDEWAGVLSTTNTKGVNTMPRTARVNSAAKELGKIIGSLEAWQHRFPGVDPENRVNSAKYDLMRLLDRLEENAESKA
jgi:hypothetical protein